MADCGEGGLEGLEDEGGSGLSGRMVGRFFGALVVGGGEEGGGGGHGWWVWWCCFLDEEEVVVVDGVKNCMLLDSGREGLLYVAADFLARLVVAKVMSLFSSLSLSPQRVVPPTSESHPATVEHECHECLLLCLTSCQESVARR